MEVLPIGVVASPRGEATDDDWGDVRSTITLDAARFTAGSVRGLDAVDDSPVLDLNPYMAEFAPRGEVRQPAWSTELMAGYW